MIRRADQRGFSKNSWLESAFSFSFAEYYDPQNMGFGALRVINDDTIAPNSGFGMHPHRDMEIVTIVTDGKLSHQDSMGFTESLDSTKVQYMSAGSGIKHSEMNNSNEPLELFQIWIEPDAKGYEPRYKSISITPDMYDKKLLKVAGGFGDELIDIRQKASLYRGRFEEGSKATVPHRQSGMGWYLFVISGEILVGGEHLTARDAFMSAEEENIDISFAKDSDILLFDVAL